MHKEAIKSILVIKLGGIGDAFLSTIILDPLKAAFPGAAVDYLVEGVGRLAIEHDPRIRSRFVLDKRSMSPLSVIRHVRRQNYDMVIDLFGNPRSALLTSLSGARHRIGLDYGWRAMMYSSVGKAERERHHGAEVNLQVLKPLGIDVAEPSLRFWFTDTDLSHANVVWEDFGLAGKFVLGVMPTGSWPSKKCEPSKLAEICNTVASRHGARCLVVWGPGDEAEAQAIAGLAAAVHVGPPASLSQNLALMAKCNAIIANDSGPMHIASSLGVPVLCLYGPTAPEGPYGKIHGWVRHEQLECIGCNLLQCPIQHQCMSELPIETVMSEFNRIVFRKGTEKVQHEKHA